MSFDDEAIRSRLHADAASTGSTIPASVIFGQLEPRLRRARRVRRIAIGTTSVVLVGAAAAALQFGLDARSTSVRTYGENQGGLGVSERNVGPTRTDEGDPSDRVGSTSSHGSVATTSTTEPTTSTSAAVPTSSGIGVPAAPVPGPSTVPGTDAPAPVVDPTLTATTTTTSVVADTKPPTPSIATHRVDSACGSIVVETVDDRVDLVDVMANAGFEVDVKSDGPENVEVGLHGGDDECELKARVVGGQLVTMVKGPDGHDESDDGSQSREPGDDADRMTATTAYAG